MWGEAKQPSPEARSPSGAWQHGGGAMQPGPGVARGVSSRAQDNAMLLGMR